MIYTVRIDFRGSCYRKVRASDPDEAIELAYEDCDSCDVYKWDTESEIIEVEEDD